MEQEVINITPSISDAHKHELLLFCRGIKKAIQGKTFEIKEEILFKKKNEVLQKYGGRNFHKNTDLAFLQSMIIDLVLQDWELKIRGQKIQLVTGNSENNSVNVDEEKAKTRRRHLLARDSQLREPSVALFIQNMERRRLTATGWHSIFSVMRDGVKLKDELHTLEKIDNEADRLKALSKKIKPYIQFVEPGEKCKETGLFVSDIWRYFRHTWINEYKSLPGRSISILVRDAAAPNHPVIGVAALGSSVAQQTCRDEWIGWEGKRFIEKVKANPTAKVSKWIIYKLEALLKEVFLKDFYKEGIITRKDILNPSEEKIKHLRKLSLHYRQKHVRNPHSTKFSADNSNLSWADRAHSNLFKSKRAVLLSELLLIKKVLKKYNFKGSSKFELQKCLEQKDFCAAVEKLVRKAKSVQVGINMMDIIVCGSVAPYNHLLGGKLVCMMLTSPEVVKYYNSKYGNYISLIASSMAGKAVIRKPQLVLLGTTSLYGAGSSQYNRIKIPAKEIGGAENNTLEYKELGYSEGYGSFHFSANTIQLADTVVGRNKGQKRVNSIFGEGANPLLRKLKDAMELLKLDSNPILNHRNKRVVYGIALSNNFNEVLIGLTNTPHYIIPQTNAAERSDLIAKYWIKRWLNNRIKNKDILSQVEQHAVSYPITHGARVPIKREEDPTLF